MNGGGVAMLTDSNLERGAKEAGKGDGRTGGNTSSSSGVAATAAASSAPTTPKNEGGGGSSTAAGDTAGSISTAAGGSGTDGGRGASAGGGGLQAQGVVGWKNGVAQALPAGTEEWTLEQLAESFEGDRLGRLLRTGDGGGEGQSAGGGGLRSKSGRGGAAAGVSLMKERVLQLKNAIAREKLKPLGNRLVQASCVFFCEGEESAAALLSYS